MVFYIISRISCWKYVGLIYMLGGGCQLSSPIEDVTGVQDEDGGGSSQLHARASGRRRTQPSSFTSLNITFV